MNFGFGLRKAPSMISSKATLEACGDRIAFDQDARSAVNDAVLETILLDEFDDRGVLSTGLNPKSRN